ncbi:HD domain containing protein [Penicillium cf. griseofulvum]|uniref:HD domain containing protein n=1 Tax=Penicillium cf. griseofulvum TaxID=2972120 RepID=A0A9W9T6C1_9EURO|nr:HD domain containing protein [Penicillium cf. griseofulvum]KAJ5422517.1 HD domain containing protein [Penicillium cf. griseofulvum]KAJ5428692.1 HD domain containing protein [Penicillium cf. griseofulvum]
MRSMSLPSIIIDIPDCFSLLICNIDAYPNLYADTINVLTHFPRKRWSHCFATIRENSLKPWTHTVFGEDDLPIC